MPPVEYIRMAWTDGTGPWFRATWKQSESMRKSVEFANRHEGAGKYWVQWGRWNDDAEIIPMLKIPKL